ncbi:MAG: hypothetical protein ACLQIB_16080 [Isosphaeraceae bacterium]
MPRRSGSMNGAPLSKRQNEVPGSPDLPARLVNELESSYAGCRWLLDRWNDLRVRNQAPNFWQASDKFKAVRLLGKQPLDLLHDTTGDLMAVFLGSHAVCPQNKSAFSELRCELGDDQFPAVRRQLDAMDTERRQPVGETAGRQVLNDLIVRQSGRLEQLALKHKARALAEAAESTSRLAFDPGAAADKVRRYEDASIRRMTRACEDLVELRRSGIFDEDALDEAELPIPARVREPRLARGSRDVIPDFARWKQPGSGDDGECSAQAPLCDDLESGSPAAVQVPETIVDGPPPTLDGERPATSENADIASDALPEESGSPAAVKASEAAVQGPRSLVPGNSGPWNILLLLLVCWWWFVGSGQWGALRGSQLRAFQEEHHAERDDFSAEHHAERDDCSEEHHAERDGYSEEHHAERDDYSEGHHAERDDYFDQEHRTMKNEPLAPNEATAICAGRAGSVESSRVAAPTGNTHGVSVQAGERRAVLREAAARNEATVIGSDSAVYSAIARSAPMRLSRDSALRRLTAGFCDVKEAEHGGRKRPGRDQPCLFLRSCLPHMLFGTITRLPKA